jgi:hypothetical protein
MRLPGLLCAAFGQMEIICLQFCGGAVVFFKCGDFSTCTESGAFLRKRGREWRMG